MPEYKSSPSNTIHQIELSKNGVIGFGIAALIFWTSAFFLWLQTDFDRAVLFTLNTYHSNAYLVMLNKLLSSYGMSSLAAVYLIYVILARKYDGLKNGRQIFILILLSFAISSLSGDVLKELFHRGRPVIEYAGQVNIISPAASFSFPSGHGVKSLGMAIPFILFAGYRGGIHTAVKCFLTILALSICFSRLFLAAHFFSDIIASMAVVSIGLPVAVYVSNRIIVQITPEKLETASKRWIFVYSGLVILLKII